MAPQDVRFHNFGDVGNIDVAVPDGVGVDHHRWTMLALVQAAGRVRAHRCLNPGLRQLRFEGPLQVSTSCRIAASTRMPVGPLVPAYKDMFREIRHETKPVNRSGPQTRSAV